MKEKKEKIVYQTPAEKRKNILFNILAIVLCCIFLFPIYWIIVNSFKIDSEIFAKVPTLWPHELTLDAYRDQMSVLGTTLKNSIIISLGSLLISMALSAPAAYGLAKYKIKGSKFFYSYFPDNTDASGFPCIDTLIFNFFKPAAFKYISGADPFHSDHFDSFCCADAPAQLPKYF